MKRQNFAIFGMITALVFLAMGCMDDNDKLGGEGHLNVYMTDAPFPYELVSEVNVTISKVDARLAETEGETESEGGFIPLMESEIAFNLLELTNGNTQQLVDMDIPAGTYDLIRVYVEGVSIVLENSESFDLTVPSGSETGIKIFIDPSLVVAGGLTTDLLLDFDVSRSFVPMGGTTLETITGFNFVPVLRASNMSTTGTIAGFVTEEPEGSDPIALFNAQISVIAADETVVTTTSTNAEGAYMIMGIDAGTYTIRAELEGYEMSEAAGVEIVAANRTEQNLVLIPDSSE